MNEVKTQLEGIKQLQHLIPGYNMHTCYVGIENSRYQDMFFTDKHPTLLILVYRSVQLL